jgi:hypothetical protein
VTNLPVNAGSYTVVGTLTGNYSGSVTDTLVIGVREVGITGLSVLSREYDGSTVATISGTPMLGNVVAGDSVGVVGTAQGSFADKNAGAGKIVPVTGLSLTGSVAGNYTIGPIIVTGEITKKPVLVTAAVGGKVYGESDPALGYVVGEGLLVGEGINGGLGREVGEGVGEYNILQGSLTAGGNYQINYTGAKFVITPAPVVLSLVDGDLVHGYDGRGAVVGVETDPVGVGVKVTYTGTGSTAYGPSTNAPVNAGSYRVDAEAVVGNYQGTTSGDLVITKRSLTINNVSVGEKTYDGSVIAPLEWGSYSLSGYVGNEGSEEARVGTPYARGKYQDAWVGSSKSVIGWFELPVLVGSGKDNYRLVFPTNLSGTIVKGEVVPEVGGLEGVYDGQRHEVVVKAIVNGSNLAVVTKYWGLSNTVYPTNEVGPIGAGSYGVEVKVAESEQNYGGGTNVVLRIGKKGAVIAAGSDTIRAGTAFNSNNYSSSGFLSGDVPSGSLVTLRSWRVI